MRGYRHWKGYCLIYCIAGVILLGFLALVVVSLFSVLAPAFMCVIQHRCD